MPGPFSFVAGSIGIASALNACISGIGKIQIARRSGSDFQTSQLRLTWLRLRLSRWGEAIQVHDDPRFKGPIETTPEVKAAKDTIFQILRLLEKSEKSSKSLEGRGGQPEDLSPFQNRDLPQNLLSLDNEMQALVSQRQKNRMNRAKIVSWVVYKKEDLSQLIENMASLIDELYRNFPTPQRDETIAIEELETLKSAAMDQEAAMQNLQKVVEGIDGTINKTIESMTPAGHGYGDQSYKDNARIHNGDTISKVWADIDMPGGLPAGPGMRIGTQRAEGNARVRNGNAYVDSDNFWS
ncbi:hypothetical protein F5B20DRAFT_321248 [Whalleya microplaca]|nr:hypothetical protein F5B20DRAFT_321248 [Whalleya microplaca]